MKKTVCISFVILIIVVFFSISVPAEGEQIVAEGKCGESISWKIYDKSSPATIKYQLEFEGSGALTGRKKDGSSLSYATRAESQFADYKDYIVSVKVGDGITEIGSFGLAFLSAAERVELPRSVTKIGSAAFESCSSLLSLHRSGKVAAAGLDLSGISSVGNYAFDGCGSISRIEFAPDFSGNIGTETFKGTSVIFLRIPAGVTEIGKNAFFRCSSLVSVEIEGNPRIADDAFKDSPVKQVYGKEGSSAEALAKSLSATFSTEKMNETAGASGSAVAFGSCGDEVYWQILNEGTNDNPIYLFDVFGTGTTMEALTASGEEITYNNQDELLWSSFVPYIKKARVGGEVKTLANCALAFLKQVEYVELSPDVRYFKDKVFESNSKMKSIYITGSEPTDGVADLSRIITHGSYQFDGCRMIKNIIFSDEMAEQEMKAEFVKSTGIVDFIVPEQFTYISYDSFEGCGSLTTLRFYGDPEIAENALHWCNNLKKIYGISGGNVEAYAKSHGIEFVSPLSVEIYLDGKLLESVGVTQGSSFKNLVYNDTVYMLYTDKALTQPYLLSDKVENDLKLYASPLLSAEGFDVRSESYHGLRSVYKISTRELKGNEAYDIVSIGAVASGKRGVRILDLTLGMNYIYKTEVVKNNSVVGLLSSAPSEELAEFAFTATGYEDSENNPIASRAAAEIYMRGYAIIREKESGKEYTIYTDIKSSTLKDESNAALEKNSALLGDAEKEFIKKAASISVPERTVYTKDELMTVMTDIYKGKKNYIVGQHTDYSSYDSFASFIDRFYNETGDILGLVALDQGTMNRSGLMNDESRRLLTEDITEYAKMGGIFSLSFHMDHPVNAELYCRGELGGEAVWDELMTKGTSLNKALMASLETARRTLQDLENAGVPVLFRPLHEMNGGWFWWCIIQTTDGGTRALDADYFVRLWRYFYNYFEVECGLDNLIWVYSPNFTNSTSSPVPVMYCYPGDEYVDIVGCDWYTGYATLDDIEGAGKSYSSVSKTGKPAAMTEFGLRNALAANSPEIQIERYNCMDELETYKSLMASGLGVTYVLNWNGMASGYLNLGRADEYMAQPETLGTKELSELFTAVSK